MSAIDGPRRRRLPRLTSRRAPNLELRLTRGLAAWSVRGRTLVAALAVVAGSFSTSDAAGGNPRKTVSREPTMVEVAVEQYNKGLKHRDKAWKYETKPAAAAVEKDRTKNLDKARREYEKAAARFESAVDKNPRMHEAFSSLGYARRQLGLYEQALTAYDTALGLDPNYAQAVEYRAETYLALDRVAEAQRAYYQLLGLDG